MADTPAAAALGDAEATCDVVAAAAARLDAERRAGWPSEAEQAVAVAASARSPTEQLWRIVEDCGARDWTEHEPAGGPEGLRRLLATRLADVNARRGGDTPLLLVRRGWLDVSACVVACARLKRARARAQAARIHCDLRVGEANENEAHPGTVGSLRAVEMLLAAGAQAGARRGGGDAPGGPTAAEVAAACGEAPELLQLLSAA